MIMQLVEGSYFPCLFELSFASGGGQCLQFIQLQIVLDVVTMQIDSRSLIENKKKTCKRESKKYKTIKNCVFLSFRNPFTL